MHGFICLHCHHRWKDDTTDVDAPQCPSCGSLVCTKVWPENEKLIRDFIVERVEHQKGVRLLTREATQTEFPVLLAAKLLEESGEFAAQPSLDELADVVEVIDAIMGHYGWTPKDLARVQTAKRIMSGSFTTRTVLVLR